jgi:hypothetical protein
MHHLSRLTLRLFAVVIILAGMIGLPYLLITIVGWPLPHHLPTVAQLRSSYSTQIPSSFWPKALSVVAWLAWLYFVLAIGSTVISFISSLGSRKEAKRAQARKGAVRSLVATALSSAGTSGPTKWEFWDEFSPATPVEEAVVFTSPLDNVDLDGFAPGPPYILIRSHRQTALWYVRNYWPWVALGVAVLVLVVVLI